jgi:hypothetical protein
MNPEPDIETGTPPDRPRRASRAPWDPPPRPTKPGNPHRGAAAGGGRLEGPDTFGGYDDDMGRGAD